MNDANLNETQSSVTLNQSPVVKKQIPAWKFWTPLLFQLILILAVPSQAFYTQVTGKTVILQTAPVDPYDFFRGYYQTLSYDISNLNTLQVLPGWKEIVKGEEYLPTGTLIYVTLEQPKDSTKSQHPSAWKPVKVSAEYPQNLSNNQIVLQGKSTGWSIEYGLERYYMPENQREQINSTITEAQMKDQQSFVVEVKVNAQGKAIPVSLWVRDRNYKF
ncbi:GDYXXLXY domain-containing protein [Planktothrix sp. FACHB-1365]|uniref:GDYXXLXY domain-containing protein n=1 Tax=Planktothrix sp. FACHB-1365 TaxID=2692855 RepID=UPI00168492BA|nr:GDYXXLXY domain-containing protein [Planktothrix sp. FACHB-1365]MBD2480820.1 GDYXXLXY domain-containing protein [Planktothrix sp. FACHB-1365]